MPNINDINGVTIANLSKLDGVTKANIAKVLGLDVTAAAAFLLDTYTGAAAGYSVRRIASSATNLMRIREDSGDTETDIGYDSNGDLDLAAIASHCGTANGYLVSWVDQSGNGNNATQSTSGAQPKIYDSSTGVVTDANGKAAVQFIDTSSTQMSFTSFASSSDFSVIFVAENGANNNDYMLTGGAGNILWASSTTQFRARIGFSFYDFATSIGSGSQYLGFLNRASNSLTFAADSNLSASTFTTSNTLTLSSLSYGGSNGYNFKMSEVILYASDQSTNRTGIETDINSEYLIYQPTDAPTSGLLATYTGAAAAYSVRQLSDKAVIAITVRRDSDDEEKRFGFDSNGDLDTTGIADFCTTANGYVSQWWDQSTNGNHATQSTAASQPQIYNGTAVITENGKPALEFVASVTNMVSVSNIGISGTGDRSQFIVGTCTDITSNATATILSYGADPGAGLAWQNTYEPWVRVGSGYQSFSGTSANTQHLYTTALVSGTNVTDTDMFIDGSAATAGAAASRALNTTNNTLKLGAGASGSPLYDGTIQEIIVYASDQITSNRTGIETDINGYFSIF